MSLERRWVSFAAGGLLIAAFLLVNVVVGSGGVRHGGDTKRYLSGAEHLRSRQPLEGAEIRSVGYSAVIAASETVGTGLIGVVTLQVIAALAAAVALFDLGCRLQGPVAGWVAALVFAANPDIAHWNFFILSDSLYISVVVLTTWAIAGMLDDPRRWWLAVLLTFVAASLRPSGWILVPITGACIVATLMRGRRTRWPAVVGLAAIFMLFAIMLPFTQTIGNDDPAHMLRNGEVIGGMVSLAMPDDTSGGLRLARRGRLCRSPSLRQFQGDSRPCCRRTRPCPSGLLHRPQSGSLDHGATALCDRHLGHSLHAPA